MSSDTNISIATGHLGCTAVLKHFQPSGVPYFYVSVGITKYSPKKDGEGFKESTTWMMVQLFGKAAERKAAQMIKGTKVYVEGELSSFKGEGDKDVYFIKASKLDVLKPKLQNAEQFPEQGPAMNDDDIPAEFYMQEQGLA